MILFHQRGKAQKSFNKTKEISTYTLPNDNGTLAIAGNIDSTAIIALVEKPSILYPSNGSSEYDNSITISQYVNNYLYTGTKTHTTIQVSTDSNFNNIVVNNFIPDTDTNARDISLPLDYSNTTLYIRIRYHSGDYCSMWSEIVSVRTKTFIVSIPTILTPSNNSEALPVNLLITTGDFNYIGVSDTHYSTHYQVSTDAAFTSLYYNVESTTSLNSAATTLKEGTTYYIRVRYRGTKYGYSSWSNVIRVSTLVPYTPIANSTGKYISQANGNYSARAGFTIYNNVLYVPRWVRDTGLYVSHGVFPPRSQGAWSTRIFDDIPAGSYLYFVPVDTGRIGSITISWNTKYYDFTNLAVHVVRNGGCGWSASFNMYLYSKEDVLLDYYIVGVSAWC